MTQRKQYTKLLLDTLTSAVNFVDNSSDVVELIVEHYGPGVRDLAHAYVELMAKGRTEVAHAVAGAIVLYANTYQD